MNQLHVDLLRENLKALKLAWYGSHRKFLLGRGLANLSTAQSGTYALGKGTSLL